MNRRVVEAQFSGGDMTSDGGILLLSQAERHLGLIKHVSEAITEWRDVGRITHSIESMLCQRVFGMVMGWEDLNDHDALRLDRGWQVGVLRDKALASSPTLSRLESHADRASAWKAHEALFHAFIAAHPKPPRELVLDIDATDDRVHGQQEGRFFHGYYGHYCFLPLYVFCGDHLLVSYLRPSNIDGARHAAAVIRLLCNRLRQQWPKVRLIVRGDSGFCRQRLIRWCERNDVDYVIGLAKNSRLVDDLTTDCLEAVDTVRKEKGWSRIQVFDERRYAAGSWDRERRVIIKYETTDKGYNPRFVVTSLQDHPKWLYKRYCQRGDMENRIKEQQLDLFADRTSCTRWWSNQWRLCLSSLAYTLVMAIRRIGLAGTDLAKAQAGTIRLKLLKMAGVILTNTRRIRFLLPTHHPHKDLFVLSAKRLAIE